MKRPGFWIALLLFIGLFAWIRWFEPRKAADTKDGPPSFLALEPTKVRAITAAWIDTTRMEKKNGEWLIVSPVSFPADPYAVEALLSRTRDLELRRRFTGNSGVEDPYGLEHPRAW